MKKLLKINFLIANISAVGILLDSTFMFDTDIEYKKMLRIDSIIELDIINTS